MDIETAKKLEELPKEALKRLNDYYNSSEEMRHDRIQEEGLKILFQSNDWRNNDTAERVYIKVAALNDFYSTNIYGTANVADIILSMKDFDNRLAQHDLRIVDDLNNNRKQTISSSGKKYPGIYSFASKYCAHHYPDVYPIYDYYVEQMLWYWQKKDNFLENDSISSLQKLHNHFMKSYSNFVNAIKLFQKKYNLEDDLRATDRYLWLKGSECFGKKRNN